MKSAKCMGCGIETYQSNKICVLCENGITQIFEELVDHFKKKKRWDLLKTLLLVESDSQEFSDRRKHFRYDFPYETVEYVLNPKANMGIFIGFVMNLSGSGLCLKTPKLLEKGENIIIKSLLFTTSRLAVVRWIHREDSTYYQVGLEFLEE
jgi:hypothetical protein